MRAQRETVPTRLERDPVRVPATVLVTDDEPTVRRCVAEALRESGYRVLEADGGAEALAVAEAYAGPIHLLLTDVGMPGIRGPELASRLRARRPETRVLFMSAEPVTVWTTPETAGPSLGKPFVLDDLDEAVRAALGRTAPTLV